MFRSFKTFLFRHRVLLSSLFAVFLYSTVIVIAAPLYNPGDTLDPTCLPGDTDCTVDTGGSGSLSIGDTIGNSPDANGILYVNNAGDLTTDALFTRDATTKSTNIQADIDFELTEYTVETGIVLIANVSAGVVSPGDTFTGDTSNATGVVAYVDLTGDDIIVVDVTSGVFQDGENFTDNTSGATGVIGVAFPTSFPDGTTITVFDPVTNDTLGAGTITGSTVDGYTFILTSGTASVDNLFIDSTPANAAGIIAISSAPYITSKSTFNQVGELLPGFQPDPIYGAGNFYYSADFQQLGGQYVGENTTPPGSGLITSNGVYDFLKSIYVSQQGYLSDSNGYPGWYLAVSDGLNGWNGSMNLTYYGADITHSDRVRLFAPQIVISADDTLTDAYYLPVADGESNQVLTTDGFGSVTWQDVGSSLIGSTSTLGTETWLGTDAGGNSASSNTTTFLGIQAGNGATNAQYSNFVGSLAGQDAIDASFSNFMGHNAGYQATNATYSIFIGSLSGSGATNAANSIFIGSQAGLNDAVNNTISGSSILIGNNTSTGGFSDSVAIGAGATNTQANQFLIDSTTAFTDIRFVNQGVTSFGDVKDTGTTFKFEMDATSPYGFIGYENAGILSGTYLYIDGGNGQITGDAGLASFGDVDVSNNGVLFTVDDTNSAISLASGANGIVSMGDINGAGNSTAIDVNDTDQVIRIFSTFGLIFDNLIGTGYTFPNARTGTPGYVLADVLGDGVLSWEDPSLLPSDEQLKSNISDLEGGVLSKVIQLKTVTYILSMDPSQSTKVGFIAQDLENYFPELVDLRSDGFKGVYYAQMTPILVQAIRELNMKVTDISDLTKENDWRDALVAWFEDATNGIRSLIVKERICVDDQCLTKEDIQALLEMKNTSVGTVSIPDTNDITSDETPSGDENIDQESTDEPVVEEETDQEVPQPEEEQTPEDNGGEESESQPEVTSETP